MEAVYDSVPGTALAAYSRIVKVPLFDGSVVSVGITDDGSTESEFIKQLITRSGMLKAPSSERHSSPDLPCTTPLLALGSSPLSRGAAELLGSLPGAASWL